ncbi:DIP2 disco-interacting protein 2 C [Goodea atripinnis]|uniref:DIP2 disco-interacting protein 2 C n=1 Tax=Goodea atripinnis TaxID=208336 RepID=A0ABV0NUE4_9TELE
MKRQGTVALVFPNNDPGAFMTAFYGCLLAEVVPVPIEVPLTRKDAGSQQIGFLLGSCGVTVALTSDACHKGLPKSPTGEIPQFKGWPKVLWFVPESKHLSKPPRDWFPQIKDANQDTAYIESVMNMMHIISIPYALMKVNPLSWIQKVCQFKGSISSCDAFLNVFQTKGLRPEVICPCASSPEALTVALRRYTFTRFTQETRLT